ncbi:MAG: BMP family ABC transporter substrate-binding protein [Vallitaleaceae bacterium]|nr:BMP family ABC transporter substrate-binding protein [Vallitaleaceae bacterium]
MENDSKSAYDKARRSGLKEFNHYKANGWNPYLPHVDALISRDEIVSEVSLGLIEIPLKKIKGTRTSGRSTAFAPNFMPILSPTTEFAAKWESLYISHLTEGIRDPLIVYEYMNWFYVEEGNKRVSVLKFHDAVLVPAYVKRLIPKYDKEDFDICLYYEFLEFYKKTKMNFMWFSELGGFITMYKWIEKNGLDGMEKEGEMRRIYYKFRKVYRKLGGNRLPITTGDALLKYLEVYPLLEGEDSNIEINIKKMWDELLHIGAPEHVNIDFNALDSERKSMFLGLSGLSAMKEAKIAFVNAKSREESAWTYGHEIGRNHIENAFGSQIKTVAINNVPEDERAYEVISHAAEENDIVFTTSPAFIHATLKASMAYKDVKFLNCSENLSFKHLRTYFGRIYEPNFLVGMIAGAMSKTNQLGYVVTYPIPEVICSINAYTLGARFVNPFAQVYVKWVEDYEDCEENDMCYQIDQQLMDMGVDIISHQESTDLGTKLNQSGIYFATELTEVGIEKRTCLANPIWNWGVFYEKIIRNIMSGNYHRISGIWSGDDPAISYWWGMDAGVVDILYSTSKLPEPLIKSVEFMKKNIISGNYHPFEGPIYDQKDHVRVDEGNRLPSEAILEMDWFVKGVIGTIPSINAKDTNHPLLELFGVRKRY